MELSSFMKKIEPFVAVAVFIMLLITSYLIYQDIQLKKEIAENCGWVEGKIRCFCEKSDVVNYELLKEKGDIVNVSLVRGYS